MKPLMLAHQTPASDEPKQPHTLRIRRKLSREQAEDVDAFGFPDDGYDYR